MDEQQQGEGWTKKGQPQEPEPNDGRSMHLFDRIARVMCAEQHPDFYRDDCPPCGKCEHAVRAVITAWRKVNG